MTVHTRDSLDGVTVSVTAPPQPPEVTPLPQEVFDTIWFYENPTYVLGDDKVSDLVKSIKTKPVIRSPGIKTYRSNQSKPQFNVSSLPGVKKSVASGNVVGLENHPCALYLPNTGSIISAPYLPRDPAYVRNGVFNNSKTLNPSETTYLWHCEEEIRDSRTGIASSILQPRADGSVEIIPQPRNSVNARKAIHLEPYLLEEQSRNQNGKNINSFVLMLGIIPGCADSESTPKPWNIKIKFGEVTVILEEGSSTFEITFAGKEPQKHTLVSGSAGKLTHHFGSNPLILSFIPVWNGLLISDSLPGSANWPDKAIYVFKDGSKNLLNEVNSRLFPEQKDGKPRVVPMKLPTISNKDRERFLGLEIKDDPSCKIDTGKRLEVTYHRCGGTLKFVPIAFPKNLRIHNILRGGSSSPEDTDVRESLEEEDRLLLDSEETSESDSPDITEEDPLRLSRSRVGIPIPITYYADIPNLHMRTKIVKLPSSNNSPFEDLIVDTERRSPDLRLPLEIWGVLLYKREETAFRIRNQDGFLTVNDVPEERILSVSISKSLDGTSGSIVWDRYDPVLGLLPRPEQRAGSIRLSVNSGHNTKPGVIFTGLGIGNAEENSPESNTITVDIFGRETKLTEEGGLRLINTPFFDGYDHVEVMKYLCNYGGVPLKNRATPYRLESSVDIGQPAIDFIAGTPVWNAMSEIGKKASTLFYFDRFGDLVYIDIATTTGVNWNYSDKEVESYGDSPDFSSLRNQIVLSALISDGSSRVSSYDYQAPFGNAQVAAPILMKITLDTNPNFEWDKMMVYTINGILPNQAEFNRIALQIAKGVSRPRATGKVTIPGNAEIELLDTFNEDWVVTSINHTINTQNKEFKTSLSLEYNVTTPVVGEVLLLPVPEIM